MTPTGEAISLVLETLSEQLREFFFPKCPMDVVLRIAVMSQILRNESLCRTYLSLVILDRGDQATKEMGRLCQSQTSQMGTKKALCSVFSAL